MYCRHCCLVLSFILAMTMNPPIHTSSWQSRQLPRSLCHVACSWLQWALVPLHWFFQLGICSSMCHDVLVTESYDWVWTYLDNFPSPLLPWAQSDYTHGELAALPGPIHDLALASLHTFSSWTSTCSGFLGFCIPLNRALNCSIFCLASTATGG